MSDLIAKIKRRSNETAKTLNLKGGIHTGIKLVGFTGKAERIGEYTRYLHFKFKKFDADGNPIGEFSTSFTELDMHSEYLDFKIKMLLTQTQNLIEALYGEAWEEKYDPIKGLVETREEAIFGSFMSKVNKVKFTRKLEKAVISQVIELVENFIDEKTDVEFTLKLIHNDKGFVNLPTGKFIHKTGDKKAAKLVLSDKEQLLIKKYK